tara:strand:+ start:1094 stop:1243 length:150 start_codon:yes stop_codon:yes gene_type:complete
MSLDSKLGIVEINLSKKKKPFSEGFFSFNRILNYCAHDARNKATVGYEN